MSSLHKRGTSPLFFIRLKLRSINKRVHQPIYSQKRPSTKVHLCGVDQPFLGTILVWPICVFKSKIVVLDIRVPLLTRTITPYKNWVVQRLGMVKQKPSWCLICYVSLYHLTIRGTIIWNRSRGMQCRYWYFHSPITISLNEFTKHDWTWYILQFPCSQVHYEEHFS